MKKKPRIYLKKKQKIIKKNRHAKCLKKSKTNWQCALLVLALKN